MTSHSPVVNLTAFLPKDLHDSLLCYTLVNSRAVEGGPDVTTCHSNGYLYEVRNKKIIRILHIDSNASFIQTSYLLENGKLVVFYLVHSTTYRLLVIKSTNKCLKIVTSFERVKMFQVYDFNHLGYPQIKIFFQNDLDNLVCEFPVMKSKETEVAKNEIPVMESLYENLEELYKYTDELEEEFNQLRTICFSNEQTDTERIFIGTINFSSPLKKAPEYKLKVCNKWIKVFGRNLILGMTFHNVGSETIHNIEILINHDNVTDYSFAFFPSTVDICYSLSSLQRVEHSIAPGEKICAVGSFEVPKFYAESKLSLLCHVSNGDLKNCILKETFEVSICDIAAQSTLGLEERFTIEDLLAIKVSKLETRLKIQTEDFQDGLMESILVEKLGFKMIIYLKNKLFYCTSTYLTEVFVMLQHVALNPCVWELAMYTSYDDQIFFLVNALYDFLPENSAILYDGNKNKKVFDY